MKIDLNTAHRAADATAISTLVGAAASWLPPTATLLTIIWMLIRIWETDTIKKWTGRDDTETKSE